MFIKFYVILNSKLDLQIIIVFLILSLFQITLTKAGKKDVINPFGKLSSDEVFQESIQRGIAEKESKFTRKNLKLKLKQHMSGLATIFCKIFGTLGKIPEILNPQVIFFLQLHL